MSQFIQLNLPEYEYNQEITKTLQPDIICVCCLARDVNFINLATCKHTSFLEYVHKFKAQHLRINNAKPHDLQFSTIDWTDNIDTIDNETIKDEENQAQYDEITTEVKIEHESSDDIDVPLSQIKKDIKKKKKKKTIEKKKVKAGVHDKYEGKIRIVVLTREEMMSERDRERRKDAYLKLPYKCEFCITGFDHELTLKDHMEKRHKQKKGGFICDICKSVLSTEISYKEHTKRHTRRYECCECGKRNNNVYSVVKHYNEQHGIISTTFTCQDCGYTTQSHRGYRYHRDKHKQKQHCTLCNSTFINNAGLRVHMYTVHKQSSRVYSCEACNKVYNAKSGLIAHMTSAHSNITAYCTLCRRHFRTEHNLAHHLRTNSKHITERDKRFTCAECEAKFLTKSSLQQHVDFVHLKNSKYECDKCCKVFKNGSALKKHVSFVHEKIRPPRNKICDYCGRGFTTLTILQSHIRTHTGERPLQCARCPATFAHSAALYTHNRLLHRDTAGHPDVVS
ncbi:zinc finger protein OZF-like isoform X2 [Galleria mellonella]|uniref:Zinc finger protein OZF-like isoform X2 n=1 Tax=Galleria mellonella TaxID=7137 RepID=A0ABM3MA11_GALME|nr:zinc finger protein OZF-like isoform X2 [Galleria mellonella]